MIVMPCIMYLCIIYWHNKICCIQMRSLCFPLKRGLRVVLIAQKVRNVFEWWKQKKTEEWYEMDWNAKMDWLIGGLPINFMNTKEKEDNEWMITTMTTTTIFWCELKAETQIHSNGQRKGRNEDQQLTTTSGRMEGNFYCAFTVCVSFVEFIIHLSTARAVKMHACRNLFWVLFVVMWIFHVFWMSTQWVVGRRFVAGRKPRFKSQFHIYFAALQPFLFVHPSISSFQIMLAIVWCCANL